MDKVKKSLRPRRSRIYKKWVQSQCNSFSNRIPFTCSICQFSAFQIKVYMNHIMAKHMMRLDQATNNQFIDKSMTVDSNAVYSSKNPIYVVISRSNEALNSSLSSEADTSTLPNANTKVNAIKLRKFSLASSGNSIPESKDKSDLEIMPNVECSQLCNETETANVPSALVDDEVPSDIYDEFSTGSTSCIGADSSCKFPDVSNHKSGMTTDSLSKSNEATLNLSPTNDNLVRDFSTPANTDVLQHMEMTLEKSCKVVADKTNCHPVFSSTVCCTVIVNTNPVYSKLDNLAANEDNANSGAGTLAVPIKEVSSSESTEQKVSSSECTEQNSLLSDNSQTKETDKVVSKKRTADVISDQNEKNTSSKKLKKTDQPIRHQQSDVSEPALDEKQSESITLAVAEDTEIPNSSLPVRNNDDFYAVEATKPPPVSCIAENNDHLPVFKESILDDCAAVSVPDPPSSTKDDDTLQARVDPCTPPSSSRDLSPLESTAVSIQTSPLKATLMEARKNHKLGLFKSNRYCENDSAHSNFCVKPMRRINGTVVPVLRHRDNLPCQLSQLKVAGAEQMLTLLNSGIVTMPRIDSGLQVDKRALIILERTFLEFPYPPMQRLRKLSTKTKLTITELKQWFVQTRLKNGISWDPEEVHDAWSSLTDF